MLRRQPPDADGNPRTYRGGPYYEYCVNKNFIETEFVKDESSTIDSVEVSSPTSTKSIGGSSVTTTKNEDTKVVLKITRKEIYPRLATRSPRPASLSFSTLPLTLLSAKSAQWMKIVQVNDFVSASFPR
jgi:hypothetical protein